MAGCVTRGSITIDPSAAQVGSLQNILVASTRAVVGGPEILSRGRSDTVHFFDFEVSVPPERSAGTVTYPHQVPPSPATDFVTVSAQPLAGPSAFMAAVNAEAARLRARDREAIVFV